MTVWIILTSILTLVSFSTLIWCIQSIHFLCQATESNLESIRHIREYIEMNEMMKKFEQTKDKTDK